MAGATRAAAAAAAPGKAIKALVLDFDSTISTPTFLERANQWAVADNVPLFESMSAEERVANFGGKARIEQLASCLKDLKVRPSRSDRQDSLQRTPKALRALASQRHSTPTQTSAAHTTAWAPALFSPPTLPTRPHRSSSSSSHIHVESKAAQTRASRLARGLSQRQSTPQATPSFGQSRPISRLGARPIGRAVGIAHRRLHGRGLFSGELFTTDNLLLARSPSATRPPSCRTSSPLACSPFSSRSASTDRSRLGVGLESELGLGLGLGLVLGLGSTLALTLTLALPLGLPLTGQPRAARHRLRQGRAHRADHARAGVGARGRALRRRLDRAH